MLLRDARLLVALRREGGHAAGVGLAGDQKDEGLFRWRDAAPLPIGESAIAKRGAKSKERDEDYTSGHAGSCNRVRIDRPEECNQLPSLLIQAI